MSLSQNIDTFSTFQVGKYACFRSGWGGF